MVRTQLLYGRILAKPLSPLLRSSTFPKWGEGALIQCAGAFSHRLKNYFGRSIRITLAHNTRYQNLDT